MSSVLFVVIAVFAINSFYVSGTRICCPRNQEYVLDTRDCPSTCEFIDPPCFRNNTRTPGCQCKPNYVYLNSTSKRCVQIGQCPPTCSKPHFQYDRCGTRCPITCQQKEPRVCNNIVNVCQPGCFCVKPYILDELSLTCVLEDDCPCPDID